MTYEEKAKKFTSRTRLDAFSSRTIVEELPIEFKLGSSSHRPNVKVSIETCDIVLWCRFLDGNWFRPYGGFSQTQIMDMINIMATDLQVVSLMELLSAKKN